MSLHPKMRLLLTLLETEHPLIGPGLTPDLDGSAEGWLDELGVLEEAGPARWTLCDSCGSGHTSPVVILPEDGEVAARAMTVCPESGTIEVPLERLRLRTIDPNAFALHLATQLGTAGARRELVRGRLWLLGRMTLGRESVEIFLARGSGWNDGAAMLGGADRLQDEGRKLLLVPLERPPKLSLPPSLVVRSLDELLSVEAGRVEVDHEALELTTFEVGRTASAGRAVRSIPVPEGTTWSNVRISVKERALVVGIGRRRWEGDFVDAGFSDGRSRENAERPSSTWELLRALAKHGNVIDYDRFPPELKKAGLKQALTRLREALRLLVPIDADPIPYDHKARRYQGSFQLTDGELGDFSLPEVSSWNEVTLELEADGIRIHIDRADGKTDSVSASFRDLELADADDRPTVEGRALEDLLGTVGPMKRTMRDAAVRRLGEKLRAAFGLPTSPLEFDRDANGWVTAFGRAAPKRR